MMNIQHLSGIKNISGIYLITNIGNGKKYIGSSFYIRYRMLKHLKTLQSNCHTNEHLQRAFNKYGEKYFKFEIIEECGRDELIEREQYWIDFYNSMDISFGYNLKEAGRKGKYTPQSLAKMAESTRKRVQGPNNPRAKVDLEMSKQIRDMLNEGILPRIIAERFDISVRPVKEIQYGIHWTVRG